MLESHPFGAGIDVAGFDSGESGLDEWLRRHALTAYSRGTARTFVLLDDDVVVGYYALAAHKVTRDALPRAIGRGGPSEVPALLLAKLALDRRRQGSGLGGALLMDAYERVVAASRLVGVRVLVVDALHDKAADFYAHHGFTRFAGSLRLYRKVSDIAEDLGGRMPG